MAGEYLLALWRHWVNVSVGGLALALSVAFAIFGDTNAWVYFAVLGALALLVAQFRVWRDMREQRNTSDKELQALQQQPVSHEHRDMLRGIANSMEGSVRATLVCSYGSDHHRAAFRAHFPRLSAPLDEWDESVQAVKFAETVLEQRLHASLGELAQGNEDVNVAQVFRIMLPFTLDAAREGLTDRILTNWAGFASSDGKRQELHLGQNLVAYADSAEECANVRDRINKSFLASQEWDVAGDVAGAVEARDRLKPGLLSILEPIQLQPEIYGRCALCEKPQG